MPGSAKKVVGIVAGKGGVGKSTVTAILAQALSIKGYSVGVIDADIYGPSMRKMLPEMCSPKQHPAHPDWIIPAQSILGIKLISMAFFKGEYEPAVVRAPIANAVIKQFLTQIDWGELDFLLIDFPPGTGDIQLTLMQQGALSGAVVVTTPQEVAALDVCKTMQMLGQMKVPIIGVIENMSYFEAMLGGERFYPFGKDGGRALAEKFAVPFLSEIPLDPLICECADCGKAVFKEYPAAICVQAFEKIADKCCEQFSFFRECYT